MRPTNSLTPLGRQAEDLEMAKMIGDDTDSDSISGARAFAVSFRAGDSAATKRAKQALAQPAQPDARSARIRVGLCLALNRLDEALAAFESGPRDDMRNAALLNDPQFDPIRTDPR